jgi:hypothetical protein
MNALTLFRVAYAGCITIVSLQTALTASVPVVRALGAVEAIAALAFLLAPSRLAGFALLACYTVAIALHALGGEIAIRLVADVATVLFLLYATREAQP